MKTLAGKASKTSSNNFDSNLNIVSNGHTKAELTAKMYEANSLPATTQKTS